MTAVTYYVTPRIKDPPHLEAALMTLRLVYSKSSPSNSRNTKLASVRCSMQRASLDSSQLASKLTHLRALRPDEADVVEGLIDRLLKEVS